MRDPESVRRMFSAISPRYDLLNRLLSVGLDRVWRRQAVALLDPSPGDLVLDLCGGTGDLSLEAARRGARVICCDFSEPMLTRAQQKFRRYGLSADGHGGRGAEKGELRCLAADALRLPFEDGTFRFVTIGFGLRNLRTPEEGLAEIVRVLRGRGTACILEFSRPSTQPLAGIYRFYLRRIIPRIGDSVSRRQGSYGYLARTIGEFPPADALAALLGNQGFENVRWKALTGGIVAVHLADKKS